MNVSLLHRWIFMKKTCLQRLTFAFVSNRQNHRTKTCQKFPMSCVCFTVVHTALWNPYLKRWSATWSPKDNKWLVPVLVEVRQSDSALVQGGQGYIWPGITRPEWTISTLVMLHVHYQLPHLRIILVHPIQASVQVQVLLTWLQPMFPQHLPLYVIFYAAWWHARLVPVFTIVQLLGLLRHAQALLSHKHLHDQGPVGSEGRAGLSRLVIVVIYGWLQW